MMTGGSCALGKGSQMETGLQERMRHIVVKMLVNIKHAGGNPHFHRAHRWSGCRSQMGDGEQQEVVRNLLSGNAKSSGYDLVEEINTMFSGTKPTYQVPAPPPSLYVKIRSSLPSHGGDLVHLHMSSQDYSCSPVCHDTEQKNLNVLAPQDISLAHFTGDVPQWDMCMTGCGRQLLSILRAHQH
jgi:hypothetical protein